jgi:hypothetical protein
MDNVMNVDKVASPDAKAHDYGAEIKGISDEDDTEEAYAHQTVLPLEEDKEPRDGVKSASAKLGIKPKHIKEEKYISKAELKFHLKQYRDGNIDGDDSAITFSINTHYFFHTWCFNITIYNFFKCIS